MSPLRDGKEEKRECQVRKKGGKSVIDWLKKNLEELEPHNVWADSRQLACYVLPGAIDCPLLTKQNTVIDL